MWIDANKSLPTFPDGQSLIKCMAIVNADCTEFVLKLDFCLPPDGEPFWAIKSAAIPPDWRVISWRLI